MESIIFPREVFADFVASLGGTSSFNTLLHLARIPANRTAMIHTESLLQYIHKGVDSPLAFEILAELAKADGARMFDEFAAAAVDSIRQKNTARDAAFRFLGAALADNPELATLPVLDELFVPDDSPAWFAFMIHATNDRAVPSLVDGCVKVALRTPQDACQADAMRVLANLACRIPTAMFTMNVVHAADRALNDPNTEYLGLGILYNLTRHPAGCLLAFGDFSRLIKITKAMLRGESRARKVMENFAAQ